MDFNTWFAQELEKRSWSNNEFARRSGISPATISLVMNDKRNPGPEFCRAIARAFRIPPEEVFRRAGILDPLPPTEEELELLRYLFNRMNEEDKVRVLAIARAFAGLSEEREGESGGND